MTDAATAALAPEPMPGSGAGVTADDITETISWADFRQWERQLASSGACSHPIRLRGRIEAIDLTTGETAPVYDTAAEHGGVLHVACGNRREAVCPACSAVYKRDARQLVRAGLAGGKGIPETITAHPCVFATLTAPSFGPVHARRMRGKTVLPCRPRRDAHARRCPHGRDISCPTRHVEDDPRLGQPMCGDCYDYQAAVLFNAWAGDLWRRFTTYLPRHLARLAGVTGRELRAALRIRYVKVAEYQARGVVHFHAVIRLDAPGEDYQPPPARYTVSLLCDAIGQAAAAVRVSADLGASLAALLRFGTQTDTRPIRRDTIASTGQPLDSQAVANYIAKYATKTLIAPGAPAQRLRHLVDIDHLRCSAHYKQMITTAWQLGGRRQTGDPRYRQWAHMLGYGGHFLTKSRRYSVTFGQLRKARTDHRRQQRHPEGDRDPWGRPLDDAEVLVLKTWTYAGTGYTSATLGAEMAAASAARAREHHGQAA
ncbi:MAG: replication initiator [Streptosporangiaceae bacterium]